SQGYRVIALAAGAIELGPQEVFSEEHLGQLTLIGLVGLIDPLRAEAKAAVTACRVAGIRVAMLTGDHPATAFAIASELQLATSLEEVVTGPQLKQATDMAVMDRLTRGARVFARVEPQQKLDIVRSLQRNGHFVAVSGDGANDAPALRAAQVGVAMGRSGTDVARETADLIITDDNFASIVAGIEEGRIAYANVRKVIFLLISTGAAELVLFTLALLFGLPLPLLAVQLLWLNLVTNGIQDVALAFEPGEGNELRCPPRQPREPIFNRLMIERVVLSALVIGSVAFLLFEFLLERGFSVDEARNGTLMLMVLFENIHVFNSRSEILSAFRHNPLRNPLLLFGTAAAQLVHIGAMYTPWISDVLHIQPITPEHWVVLLGLALTVLVVMELHKILWRRMAARREPAREVN
ncbi:MAG: HAD-IC family P-type ATPase, partial [Gammaproteobacteria bacterium]